ncbi:MAG: hypothetical protein IPN62_14395 [Flavobacteriales bacterium]|jgi:hypothetical protein|nr:hypothetical protein [Flavobacteriales bacterium]HOZ40651.1 hypothetical protein [Flavobacteriales bacterium]
MKLWSAIAFVLCSVLQTRSQVLITGPLELSPEGTGKITGLALTTRPDALLSLGLERSGVHRNATPDPGTVWELDLEALPDGPSPGTTLLVKPPTGAVGAVLLSVHDQGPFAVMRSTMDTLRANEIPADAILYVVFDGTRFQLLNGDQHVRRTCPSGWSSIGGQICIETAERAAASFEQAILTCADAGARLCSWGEFVAGCQQRSELGLANMTNNLEWTGNTANEDNFVRVAGGADCHQAGTTASIGPTRTYRCCYPQ